MTIPRIIIEDTISDGQLITIKDAPCKYLIKVNRLKAGEKFYCMDKAGSEFLGEVVDLKSSCLTAYVYLIRKPVRPAENIEVCFGLLKGEKNEFVVKAGTQLGITAFSPLLMSRTVVKLDDAKRRDKRERLKRVAEDTARTSFLSYVPEINKIRTLTELNEYPGAVKLLFSESKGIPLLKETEAKIRAPKNIVALFGPEGGIEDNECEMLEQQGFVPVSLGERALKAEFAFTFAMSVIIYLKRGEF